METIREYTVYFKPDEDGGYIVTVPALPGLVTYGETLEEAKDMVSEAIAGHIEMLAAIGEIIPTDGDDLFGLTLADKIAVAV